jgi:hypothetical protein
LISGAGFGLRPFFGGGGIFKALDRPRLKRSSAPGSSFRGFLSVMPKDPFHSPRSLISHARDEIKDAEARINAFFAATPIARVVEIDTQTGQRIFKARLTEELPDKITVVVKDAAGNLRDALDHAVYASTAVLVGGNPSKTGFPFAQDANGVLGELNGKRLCGNAPEIRPLLAAFNPYPGGNDLLSGLNSIRNPNTHRILVPVGVGAAHIGNITIRNGVISGGTQIGHGVWDAAKNEFEYMRLGPTSHFESQVQIAFNVSFKGIEKLEGQPIIPTLSAIAGEVERVVSAIEAETGRILSERP